MRWSARVMRHQRCAAAEVGAASAGSSAGCKGSPMSADELLSEPARATMTRVYAEHSLFSARFLSQDGYGTSGITGSPGLCTDLCRVKSGAGYIYIYIYITYIVIFTQACPVNGTISLQCCSDLFGGLVCLCAAANLEPGLPKAIWILF